MGGQGRLGAPRTLASGVHGARRDSDSQGGDGSAQRGRLPQNALAERGARDGTRPAGRQLRQRDWRRASWVPQAIRAAPQPREPNVSSDRGQAGGRSAGWRQDESIDFSQGSGAGLFWIRPMLAAAVREVSASAILPWRRRGRWIRGRPNRWACGSQQGQGAAPQGGQIAQLEGSTKSETGS